MMSYMETFYVGRDNDYLLKTGVGAAMDSNAETWRKFRSYRRLEVSQQKATFLLDYYNAKGDLADTIFLDNTGFKAITGEPVRSKRDYERIDRKYWDDARAAKAKSKGDTP
jgi:hypothetical protein